MSEEDGALYFGYGSNLDTKDWMQWCEQRGADPSGRTELEPCWLPDHRLTFHYHSRSREGGAADVTPAGCGHAVPGVLFSLNANALANMDRKEGHPSVYCRTTVNVLKSDGTSVEAMTYRVTPAKISDYVPPTSAYVDLIERNLIRHKLPIGDLKSAIDNLDTSYPVRHLFVYGTLMKGQSRHGTITHHISNQGLTASALGTLYDLGTYPGMRSASTGVVYGELYEMDDVFSTLQSLDRVEGFYGFQSSDSLFHRTLIQVEVNGERVWAWSYFYAHQPDSEGIIESGDWREWTS